MIFLVFNQLFSIVWGSWFWIFFIINGLVNFQKQIIGNGDCQINVGKLGKKLIFLCCKLVVGLIFICEVIGVYMQNQKDVVFSKKWWWGFGGIFFGVVGLGDKIMVSLLLVGWISCNQFGLIIFLKGKSFVLIQLSWSYLIWVLSNGDI